MNENTNISTNQELDLQNKIDTIIKSIKAGKTIKITRGEKTYILLDSVDTNEMRWKVESETGSIGSIGMSVYNIDSVYNSLESEEQKKETKQMKEPKAKAPKESKTKAKPAYEFIRELTTEDVEEIKAKLVEAGYTKPISPDYIRKQIKNRVK